MEVLTRRANWVTGSVGETGCRALVREHHVDAAFSPHVADATARPPPRRAIIARVHNLSKRVPHAVPYADPVTSTNEGSVEESRANM